MVIMTIEVSVNLYFIQKWRTLLEMLRSGVGLELADSLSVFEIKVIVFRSIFRKRRSKIGFTDRVTQATFQRPPALNKRGSHCHDGPFQSV